MCPGRQGLSYVSGIFDAPVADNRHPIMGGLTSAFPDGAKLGHAYAGDYPGGAYASWTKADLYPDHPNFREVHDTHGASHVSSNELAVGKRFFDVFYRRQHPFR